MIPQRSNQIQNSGHSTVQKNGFLPVNGIRKKATNGSWKEMLQIKKNLRDITTRYNE